MIIWTLFIASCLMLYWIYDGYGRFLQLICLVRRPWSGREKPAVADFEPTVTVLLTVHNEQATIVRRVQNLLQSNYPADKLTIMVASDGSTDQTDALVESIDDPRVRLFRGTGQGKTSTQNAAIAEIDSELVFFTDAGALFDPDFIRNGSLCFADPGVGGMTGYVRFTDLSGSATARSQGFYWNYELKLRTLESELGIMAVVAGSSSAVRRRLLLPMNPAIGEDCIVPLDIVSQGYRVVHAVRAHAFDEFGDDSGTTLRARIRMTLRNWQGTWSRPQLLNPLRHPGYAFALWSHKLLRWMSPLFLILAVGSVAGLMITDPGVLSVLAAAPFLALFTMGAFGAAGKRLPGAGPAFSFLLANTAFLIGLMRVVRGNRVLSYRNS